MKKEHRYYDVFPRIVPAHQQTTITIHPRFDPFRFQNGNSYLVSMIPSEGLAGEVQWPDDLVLEITPQDGDLLVPCQFASEQEYLLMIRTKQDEPVAEFRLYALEQDLFARRPYKGDTHMHTYYSDGKESPAYLAASCRKIGMDFIAITDHRQYAPSLEQDLFARRPYKGDTHMHTYYSDGKESPAYLTASCRKIGMDFIAITDHRQYAPSLEAIRAFADGFSDLRIFPGEEVHPPENRVHIVNFGGSFSVNDLFDTDAYRTEAAAIAENLTYLPAEIDRYPYASCLWTFEKIRQGGGLGIFCHPYWYSRKRFDVPVTLTDLLFQHQPYDALEVLGGFHLYESESNVLQVARYHELHAQGKRIPIVGASDSHGCENGQLFSWYYTIVFSPTLDLPDLITSIKDCYSVAVEALPNEMVRAFGPFRLVCFAMFLLREVFPAHDELCLEEGRLMLAHAAGDPQAAPALQSLQGRTAQLYEHFWRIYKG